MKKIASDMEVSVGCLQYHFPVVCKEVVQKYKQRIADTKKSMEVHARKVALAFFCETRVRRVFEIKKECLTSNPC